MAKQTPLDQFGSFLMEHLRDRGLDHLDDLLVGRCKAPSLKRLQRDLKNLTKTQQTLVRRVIVESLDSAIHDFLFALQEQGDDRGPIRIRVRGKDVAAMSDGLQGELFTEDGWYARFSSHGEPQEEP